MPSHTLARRLRLRLRLLLLLALLALPALPALPAGAQAAPDTTRTTRTTEYRNARWFDGVTFTTGSRFVRNGLFVTRPRQPADSVVPMQGRFVVPPYADAHTHSPDARFNFATIRDMYLRGGVFYVQVLGNSRAGRREILAEVNTPAGLDAVFANTPITAYGGHPQLLYESLGLFRMPFPAEPAQRLQAARSRAREGDVYLTLDSLPQLPALVRRLRRDTVPILKLMLLDTEHRRTIATDSTAAGSYGLATEVVRPLVDSAHAMGRRVWAHVETAYDAQLAMDGGIDGLAHVPGYGAGSAADSTLDRYRLSEALARRIGRSGIPVVTTIGLARGGARDTAAQRRVRTVFEANIRLLQRFGARLITGSDTYSDADIIVRDATALNEVLRGDAASLLRLRAVTTPQAIFPGRRIGVLRPGYEASFLILGCNPLARESCLLDIQERFKQGVQLRVPPAPPPG
ncbi:MAG: amidohydrolase family protein [Gemmatimonadaceae bacterium]|nr:amidohydrolase family protein [Gemmatimonadaceae bacterium]